MREAHDEAEIEDAQLLVGVLADLIHRHGPAGAASELGVSYQTVRRSVAAGDLSSRLRAALKRHLLLREGVEVPDSPWEMRLYAVEQRFSEMEERLRAQAGVIQDIQATVARLQRDLEQQGYSMADVAAGVRTLQQRVEALTAADRREADAPALLSSPGGTSSTPSTSTAAPLESGPNDGDERKQALLKEWEAARSEEAQARTRLERVIASERKLTSELALIREFRVCFPLEASWSETIRAREIGWRQDALRDRRRDRSRLTLRRWVRRVLTLGLWWS